jgi:hypothetical protein
MRRQQHRRRGPRHGRSEDTARQKEPLGYTMHVRQAAVAVKDFRVEPRTSLTASGSSIQRRTSGTQSRSCPDRLRDGAQPPLPTAGHPNCHKPMAPRETKVPVSGSAVGRVDGRQDALGLVDKSAIAHGRALTTGPLVLKAVGADCRQVSRLRRRGCRAEPGRAWCWRGSKTDESEPSSGARGGRRVRLRRERWAPAPAPEGSQLGR